MWSRIQYRIWQFWQIVTAQPLPEYAQQEIVTILSPAEHLLFQRFSLSDQRHGYRVLCLLRDKGYQEQALLVAALLHDIGKTQVMLRWWERVFIVLAMLGGKKRLAIWGQGSPTGWRKGLVVKAQHPTWGADMAVLAGSCDTTVYLIRYHQEKIDLDAAATPENKLLQALQWADDQS